MTTPVRIQIRRTAGWKLPADAVKVDRSTLYGNPFRSDRPNEAAIAAGARTAADAYRIWLTDGSALSHLYPELRRSILDKIGRLKGHSLACWCRPGDPCHADVLLELANRSAS
jgi:hypothetical protein